MSSHDAPFAREAEYAGCALVSTADLGDPQFWDLRRFELELERKRVLARLALGATELTDDLEQVEAELERVPRGRAQALARRLNLGDDELSFAWTVIAAAFDPRLTRDFDALGGAEARGGASLTLHTALHRLDANRARRLARDLHARHPLVCTALLVPRGADASSVRLWSATERLGSYLAGRSEVDPAIAAVGGLCLPPDDAIMSPQHTATLRLLDGLITAGSDAVVLLEGPLGVGRRTLAAIAAKAAGRPLVHVDLARRQLAPSSLEGVMQALTREAFLRPDSIVLLANIDDLVEPGADRISNALRLVAGTISALDVPVVLTTAMPGMMLPSTKIPVRIRVTPPSSAERLSLWHRALPDASAAPLADVAFRYRIGPGSIDCAAATASLIAVARGSLQVEGRDLVSGIRSTIAERMGGLAHRVDTSATWEDLVLSSDTSDQIRGLLARVQKSAKVLDEWGYRSRLGRGTGIAALFSGPPGTGKTMVAGVIAKILDLELYQVDLSRVVSKWIGETEKQLSQVFDAAEAGHVLLLFDEADSLFAKRTEVKGSTDRYANLEVNYLLQRIEAFEGIAVLTTNMDTSLDPALKRRLAAHIVFWGPDEDERRTLWKKMIAENTPIEGELDLEKLAIDYPDMSGANIRNAAISAAFLAAAEDGSLTQRLLERAARLEYNSMGRVLGRKDNS